MRFLADWSGARRLVVASIATAVVASLLSSPSQAADVESDVPAADGNKVAAELQARFQRSGEPQDFWVSFDTRADTSGAQDIDDWAERGLYVFDRLRHAAQESQAQTIERLEAAGVDYTSYWIVNAIRVNAGDHRLAQQLAAEPAVERVFAPVAYEQPDPINQRIVSSRTGENAVNIVEWGVQNIQADHVWAEYGIRGDGIVVANVDTGVQFDHPALVNSYRGSNGDGTFSNDYNWFDPATGTTFPTDGHGHGTHTMGTMVGDDGAANQVGVAPGAKWIAARGCESNSCSDASLLAASQWMLAPTRIDGSDPDPAQRPHIVNNSWGSEFPTNDPFLEDIQQAWADAGIMGVWSNGNAGPGCATSGSPGSRIINYSVGAYDSTNTIAGFSSRGAGQDGETKPNISAPGVDVRSSYVGGQYAVIDGTSMAAPHVAGAVALLWAADPSLVGDLAATRQRLDDTAVDTPDAQCGGTDEDNNVYGEGRLDALALVDTTNQGNFGTATGTVTDDQTGAGIRGALIRFAAGDIIRSTRTGDDGGYTVNVPAGAYQATVTAFGYEPTTVPVTVTAGQTTTTDIPLVAAPGFTVTGKVVDQQTGNGIPGTTVTVAGSLFAATTAADGTFTVEHVPGPSSYVLTIDAPGECNRTIRRNIDVTADVDLGTVSLVRNLDTPRNDFGPPYGYSCVVEPAEWIGGDTQLELPPLGDRSPITVDLPFEFTYFGEAYQQLTVRQDGIASFRGDFATTAAVRPFPSIGRVDDPNATLWTRTAGAAPDRTFTVEWRGWGFVLGDPSRVTTAITLHENGDIVFAYQGLDPADPEELGRGHTVGIQDHSPDGRATSRTRLRHSAGGPVLSDARQILFELPPNGFVAGEVVDRVTRGPVPHATVDFFNEHGTRLVRKTADAEGRYRLQLMTGRPYSIEVHKPGYAPAEPVRIELSTDREVRPLMTTLHGGRIEPSASSVTVRPGRDATVRLSNGGDRTLDWWVTTHSTEPTAEPGSLLASADLTPFTPFGVQYVDGNWWVSGVPDPAAPQRLIEMSDGRPTGAEIDLGAVAAQLGITRSGFNIVDMTWIPDRGWLCMFAHHFLPEQIVCVDPDTSDVTRRVPTGTASPEAVGLAYDAEGDRFFVGTRVGGFQTEVLTLAGIEHPTPGEVQHRCVFAHNGGGLVYNPASRTLWTTLRKQIDEGQTTWQFDPGSCAVTSKLPLGYRLPSILHYGFDVDSRGNFLHIHSGAGSFVPSAISTMQTNDPFEEQLDWLHVSTTSGTLDPHRSQKIQISVDWEKVPEGVTGAELVFRGNGGANSEVTVRIQLAEERHRRNQPV